MRQIANLTEFHALLNDTDPAKVIVVEFYKGNEFSPVFEDFSRHYTSMIFVRVSTDHARDIVEEYKIRAPSTYLAFKNKKKINNMIGARRNVMQMFLDDLMKK